MNPRLLITDGTDRVDLLDMEGWLLKEWKPSVPESKGGGVFRNSPLVDGRRLVYRRLENVFDTFNLVGDADSQNLLIASIRKLQTLLEKAVAYWTSNWQNEPVWIETKATNESNIRYAVIVDYRLNGFGGPFQQPFFGPSCRSATEAMLTIEHMIWQETQPGAYGECVPISLLTDYVLETEYSSKSYYPDASDADTTYTPVETSLTNPMTDVNLVVGYDEQPGYAGLCEFGIVFNNVDIPAGAILHKALLKWTEVSAIGYEEVTLQINGQSQGFGGIKSVTVTNGGQGYHAPIAIVHDLVGTGASLSVVQVGGVITEINIINEGQGYTSPTIEIADKAAHGGWGAAATATAGSMNNDAVHFTTPDDYKNRERTTAFSTVVARHDETLPAEIDVSGIVEEIISNANWTSGDGLGIFVSLISGKGFRKILSFDNGSDYPELFLEWSVEVQPLGRETTCSAEVYVANKENESPVNFIFCYDDSEGTYSDNLVGWDFSADMPLFQDAAGNEITPAVDDILYFGSCPLGAYDFGYGPFDNLIFDLQTVMSGIEGKWQIRAGGAWNDFDLAGGNTNMLCGDQSAFQTLGVGSLAFMQISTWATVQVTDGTYNKTGYWIRFIVTAVDSPDGPIQQHRDIYTANKGYIEVGEDIVPGDIPALAKIIFESAACTYRSMNTLVIGLRTLARSPNFSAYLNTSLYQNPYGVSFQPYGAEAHVQTSPEAPTGTALDLTGLTTDNETFEPVGVWSIATAANNYFGVYHAYVRASCSDTIQFRIKVVFGTEHNVYYSDIGVSSSSLICAIDLGQLAINAPPMRKYDYTGFLKLYLEVLSEHDAHYNSTTVYDLVLIPADEWCGNFGMPNATSDEAVLGYGKALCIDGITIPRDYRAIQTPRRGLRIDADWSRLASSEPILQTQVAQRLWFLQYQNGTGLYSRFENCGAVRIERSARYLLMRGNG